MRSANLSRTRWITGVAMMLCYLLLSLLFPALGQYVKIGAALLVAVAVSAVINIREEKKAREKEEKTEEDSP